MGANTWYNGDNIIGNEKRIQEGILAKLQKNSLVINNVPLEYFTGDRTLTVPVMMTSCGTIQRLCMRFFWISLKMEHIDGTHFKFDMMGMLTKSFLKCNEIKSRENVNCTKKVQQNS